MKTNSTGMLFLIGAGAGVVAAYLLDPDRGQVRRERLTHAANEALEHAGEVVGQTVSHLTDASRHATDRLSSLASDASESARQTGTHWFHRGQKHAARGKSILGHLFREEEPTIQDRARETAKKIGSHFDREHLVRPVVIGSGTATLLGGIGVYYFFGSSKAAARRRALAEKVHVAARETGELGRRSVSFLLDKISGISCQSMTADEHGNTARVGEAVESGEPTLTGLGTPPARVRFR